MQVRALSTQRGPAPVAQQLYEETPASVAAREQAAATRRIAPEPAHAIEQGQGGGVIRPRARYVGEVVG